MAESTHPDNPEPRDRETPDQGEAPSPAAAALSAEICTVGTELLLGQIVDTNAAYIAQQLALIGINVFYRSGVGDNPARMRQVIETALSRSDAVVLTGGLGPTQDDLTAQVLADVFDEPLVKDTATEDRIRERVERLKLRVAASSYRQAMIPLAAVALPNDVGMAPGIWLEKNGKIAIALPGVPSEMKHLLVERVIPRLKERTGRAGTVIRSRVLRMVGIAESLAEERIIDLIRSQDNPTIAPYAGSGELKLRITARAASDAEAAALIDGADAAVRERLSAYIFGVDDETLNRAVGRILLEKHLTIATAESCTGGLVGAALTEMPGSSGYLVAGEITYSNAAKQQILGVPQATLEAHGAVSAETAAAMAEGVRRLHQTDLGVSTTGIAGPGGGSPEKPVGLVFIGICDSAGARVERRLIGGDRSDVRRRTVLAALQMIFERLKA